MSEKVRNPQQTTPRTTRLNANDIRISWYDKATEQHCVIYARTADDAVKQMQRSFPLLSETSVRNAFNAVPTLDTRERRDHSGESNLYVWMLLNPETWQQAMFCRRGVYTR